VFNAKLKWEARIVYQLLELRGFVRFLCVDHVAHLGFVVERDYFGRFRVTQCLTLF
jgi:hypothetical protein